MGVSVRAGRNTRVHLPFWVAIPAYLLAACAWAIIVICWGIVYGIPWLVVRLVQAARR